jgi:hypothetical protein
MGSSTAQGHQVRYTRYIFMIFFLSGKICIPAYRWFFTPITLITMDHKLVHRTKDEFRRREKRVKRELKVRELPYISFSLGRCSREGDQPHLSLYFLHHHVLAPQQLPNLFPLVHARKERRIALKQLKQNKTKQNKKKERKNVVFEDVSKCSETAGEVRNAT